MNKLSLQNFKNLSLPREATKEDAIYWGVIFSAVLFLFLVFWNGYIFYSSLIVERPAVEVTLPKNPSLTEKDVTEIIKLLDERRQKFNSILGTAPVSVTKTEK